MGSRSRFKDFIVALGTLIFVGYILSLSHADTRSPIRVVVPRMHVSMVFKLRPGAPGCRPVDGYLAEEPVLHRIPFGRSGMNTIPLAQWADWQGWRTQLYCFYMGESPEQLYNQTMQSPPPSYPYGYLGAALQQRWLALAWCPASTFPSGDIMGGAWNASAGFYFMPSTYYYSATSAFEGQKRPSESCLSAVNAGGDEEVAL